SSLGLCRDKNYVMGLRIQCHRSRTWRSLNRFCHGKLGRAVLVDYGQCAVLSVRAECKTCLGVEGRGVRPFSDRRHCDDLAAHGIQNRHFAVSADGEDSMVLPINSETARLLGGSDWPVVLNVQISRVELDDFTLVLDVDEDVAFFVGHGKL